MPYLARRTAAKFVYQGVEICQEIGGAQGNHNTSERLGYAPRSVKQGRSKTVDVGFDKPMIFYPLPTFRLYGCHDIIIAIPHDQTEFYALLGDGSELGNEIHFAIQPEPARLVQAHQIAAGFLGNKPSTLLLDGNIFCDDAFAVLLARANARTDGAAVFGYYYNEPIAYGVVSFDAESHPETIEKKPVNPWSNYAVTGLYFYGGNEVDCGEAYA